jgi:hypothetical protein
LSDLITRLERIIESYLGGSKGFDRDGRRAAEIVSGHLCVTIDAILGRCRQAHIVTARHLTWYLLVKHGPFTPQHIAAMWQVNHGSILYAIHSISDRLIIEKKLAEIALLCIDAFTGPRPSTINHQPSTTS